MNEQVVQWRGPRMHTDRQRRLWTLWAGAACALCAVSVVLWSSGTAHLATVLASAGTAVAAVGSAAGGGPTTVTADPVGLLIQRPMQLPRRVRWADVVEFVPATRAGSPPQRTLVAKTVKGGSVHLGLPADHAGLLGYWESVRRHRGT